MTLTAEEAVTEEKLRSVALSWPEYHRIVERLGRPPNDVELGMFGALWSEHCGYKRSKALLRQLPTESPRFLVTAGEENAGAVDIGDGLAIVFKIGRRLQQLIDAGALIEFPPLKEESNGLVAVTEKSVIVK